MSATFTLNGPDVSVQQVNGATGMVGIRLTVKAVDGATQTITDDARDLVPVVRPHHSQPRRQRRRIRR